MTATHSRQLLVTGANGFLARAVADRLPCSWQPIALLRPHSRNCHRAYVAFHDSVDALCNAHPDFDAVLHLAAHIPDDLNAQDPQLVQINVDLISRLVQAYPQARHVHASSVSVYGVPKALPLAVTSSFIHPNRYGLSKLAGECIVGQASRHAVIRFSSIIGTGMRTGSFIPSAVEGARMGTIQLRGDGNRQQNYVDVRDAAHMCLRALEDNGNFTTLGVGTRSHSNLDIAELLASMTGASIVHEGSDANPSLLYTIKDAMNLGPCEFEIQDTLADMVRKFA